MDLRDLMALARRRVHCSPLGGRLQEVSSRGQVPNRARAAFLGRTANMDNNIQSGRDSRSLAWREVKSLVPGRRVGRPCLPLLAVCRFIRTEMNRSLRKFPNLYSCR
jgi:hypothetical protein